MKKRVFFSLVPEPQVCLEIDQWRSLCWPNLGRPVPLQNFHLTLAFLGAVSAEAVNELMDDVDGIELDIIQLTMDQVGYWSKPDVLWLGSSLPPAALATLAKQCRRLANRVGIKVDSARFLPHITLARRLVQPPPSALIQPEFSLQLHRLSLIESTLHPDGSQYRELASWA